MIHLGDVPASSTLYIPFATYGKTNGESITLTGLAVTDIEIYKNGSTTQRASDNGYALLDTDGIDFDGITGIHGFSIDLSDNSDSGFYAVGSFYWVVVSAVTVDSQTVNFVAATFRIRAAEAITGKPKVDVDGWLGTACATPTTNGVPEVDVTHIAGSAVSTSTAQLGVNVVQAAGTAWGSGAITAASIAADAITDAKVASDVTIASVTGAVGSVTGNVGGNVTGSVGSIATGGIAAASFAAGAIDATAIADNAIDAGAIATGAITSAKFAAGAITATVIATDAIDADAIAADAVTEIQSGLSTLTAAGIRTAVGLASANLDTQLTAIDDYLDTEVAAILAAVDTEVAAIKAKTDLIPSDVDGKTLTEAFRLIAAATAGNISGAGTGTEVVKGIDGSTTRITATVDSSGNRTMVYS